MSQTMIERQGDTSLDGSMVDDPGTAAVRVLRGPGRLLFGLMLLWFVIVAAGGQAAYFWADSKPDVWAARSEIQYRGDTWIETQTAVLNSGEMYRAIAQTEGMESLKFREQLGAGQVPGTEFLFIEFRSEDPEQALRVVRNYTETYMARFELPDISPQEVAIQEQLAPLEAELEQVLEAERIAAENNTEVGLSSEQSLLRSQADDIRADISTLRQQLTAAELARIAAEDNRPTIATTPFLIEEPVEPNPAKTAVLGAIAGAVLASLLLFILVWRVL